MNKTEEQAYTLGHTQEAIKLLVEKYEFLNGEMSDDEKMAMVFGYLNGLKEAK